ncbi:MAG: hypothetical protein EXS05_06605 [Planctomycetaceae bacterium]|nr:hypothetical protein [Planctomycetaceae bacterium]
MFESQNCKSRPLPTGDASSEQYPSVTAVPRTLRSKLCLGLVGFIVTILVALGGVWFYSLSTLDSELTALRAKGLPTTAKELTDFYAVPNGIADTTNLWVSAINSVQAANLRTRASALPIVGTGPTPIPAPGQGWAELEAVRTLLGELGGEFQAIRLAAEAGGQVRFPVDMSAGIATLYPYTEASRVVARLLTLDAHVCAHDGSSSQALHDIRAIFALSDALRGEPTMISQLVRIAIYAVGCDLLERLLPYCEWSDAELESLQTAIRSARFKDEMRNALSGERAIFLIALDDMPLGPFRQSNAREALQFYETAIEGLSGSWPEARSQQRELDARINSLTGLSRLRFTFVSMLLPPLELATVADTRADARQKCANAAIAVERYRQKHNRLPQSLAEIEQDLMGFSSEPAAELIDPFDGQPLRYQVEAARILIYSVGENGQDDGGDCPRDEERRPLDIGFILKVPDSR